MIFIIVLGLVFLPTIILLLVSYLKWRVAFYNLLGIGLLMIAYTIALGIIKMMLFEETDTIINELGYVLGIFIKNQYYIYLYIITYLGFFLLFLKQRNSDNT